MTSYDKAEMHMTGNAGDDEALSIFSSDRDRGGNQPPPPAEQPAQDEPKAPEQAAPSQDETRDDKPDRHVPLSELLTERNKLREERRLREEYEQRLQQYDAQLRAIQARLQPAPEFQPPDPTVDPEAAIQFHVTRAMMDQESRFLNALEDDVRRQHGTDKVDEALREAQRLGVDNQLRGRPNPWRDLMDWHGRHRAMADIGPDPEAYKKRVREEVLAELKKGAPAPRFPGTLGTATAASGQQGAVLTDEAMAQSVFATNRDRRR